MIRCLLAVLLVLALPAWAAPFATCELPSDPRITACDYEDAGTVVRVPAVNGQCKVDISDWIPGSVHNARCRSVDTSTGEVSTWFEATLDGPANAALTLSLAGGAVVVPPPPSSTVNIFGNASPTLQDTSDTSSVNLGLRITTSVAGQVLGVRFYKQAGNGGTHIAGLWSSTGALLAQATFTGESATGWQEVMFAQPVSVAAGSTFTVGYLAPQGRYPYTSNASWPLVAGVLSALGGVYAYGSSLTRPTASWQGSHYWIDVIFKTN